MRIIFLILAYLMVAVSCSSSVPNTGVAEVTEVEGWNESDNFCLRHVEAAKVDPIYLVDICVIACDVEPDRVWCEDLRKIVDADERRYSTNAD